MVDEGKFILGLVDLVKKISFNGFIADFFVAVFIGIIAKCAGSTFIFGFAISVCSLVLSSIVGYFYAQCCIDDFKKSMGVNNDKERRTDGLKNNVDGI